MAKEEKKQKKSILRSILSLVILLVVVLLASFLLRKFVFQAYEIPSASMENTIMTGDLVFSEKVSYYGDSPSQGDVVTFEDPEDPSRTLIKRVIATEGQTVDLRDGDVYVNGEKLDEPYTNGKPSYPYTQTLIKSLEYPYTVPTGEIWVMGDNRTNSQDSRYFGSVPVSKVTGHAIFKYWPLNHIGALD